MDGHPGQVFQSPYRKPRSISGLITRDHTCNKLLKVLPVCRRTQRKLIAILGEMKLGFLRGNSTGCPAGPFPRGRSADRFCASSNRIIGAKKGPLDTRMLENGFKFFLFSFLFSFSLLTGGFKFISLLISLLTAIIRRPRGSSYYPHPKASCRASGGLSFRFKTTKVTHQKTENGFSGVYSAKTRKKQRQDNFLRVFLSQIIFWIFGELDKKMKECLMFFEQTKVNQ